MSYAVRSQDGLGFIPFIGWAIAAAIGGKVAKEEFADREEMTRFTPTPACKRCVPFKCYVTTRKCEGSIEEKGNCEEKWCPPQTWSNANWVKVIGEDSWRWWLERKIRLGIDKWARPGFGYRTTFGAYAASHEVSPRQLPFTSEQLAQAWKNFNALFPDEHLPQRTDLRFDKGRWRLRAGVIFNPSTTMKPGQSPRFRLGEGVKADAGTNENPEATDIAFYLWTPLGMDWTKDPKAAKDMAVAFKTLGLSTEAQKKKFYDDAIALFKKVPGAEPDKGVRLYYNLIAFEPSKAIINGWLIEFVRMFAPIKVAGPAVRPAAARAVASAIKAKTPAKKK